MQYDRLSSYALTSVLQSHHRPLARAFAPVHAFALSGGGRPLISCHASVIHRHTVPFYPF
jgi:hypothetical protein